jgi:hypothetical protein
MVVEAALGRSMKILQNLLFANLLLLSGATRVFSAAEHALIVAGLGGEAEYETRFASQASELKTLLQGAQVDTVEAMSGAETSKERILAAIQRINKASKSEDVALFVFVGHGSFDGEYKFNIPGTDITAAEISEALKANPAKRQVVVLLTSASGGAIEALRQDNRVLVAATRSGMQKNAPVFPRFFIEALRGAAADKDKNDVVTVKEAFDFATVKVKQFYESNQRLATENAVLDKTSEALASRLPITQGEPLKKLAGDANKQKLLQRRETLENQIDKLKFSKETMDPGEYRKQLQPLLLELAKLQREIDQ